MLVRLLRRLQRLLARRPAPRRVVFDGVAVELFDACPRRAAERGSARARPRPVATS